MYHFCTYNRGLCTNKIGKSPPECLCVADNPAAGLAAVLRDQREITVKKGGILHEDTVS